MTIDTCNGAHMAGYTEEYIAIGDGFDLHIMVRPGTDLDDVVWAFNTDAMEMINLNGWMFTFEPVET